MTGNNTQNNGSTNLEMAQSNQDLIMTKGKRKKRTWIAVGVVSTIVVALLIAAIVILVQSEEPAKDTPEEAALSLEDIIFGKVNPKLFNGTWVSGNELLYTDSDGSLVLLSLEASTRSPKAKILIDAKDPLLQGNEEFEISADKKYLKIAHSFQKIYRHSFKARYTILNLETSEQTHLTIGKNVLLLLVTWSTVGNALGLVFDNNIYYKPSVVADPIQLTTGSAVIYNGIPDWVYEEEVFSSNKALWFSPDGNRLAYGRFDDTYTPIMVLPIYGEPGNPLFQYPKAQLIKYPKAGTPNPTVSLHWIELSGTNESKVLDPPTSLSKQQPILSAVTWASDAVVAAIWMNRVQNEAAIVTYDLSSSTPDIIRNLKESAGWLELFTPPLFSRDGSRLVLILSHNQGNLGSFRHVVLLKNEEHAEPEPLTKGAFVVTDILKWNQERNVIFYAANTEEDPGVQHIYSVGVESKTVECLSCSNQTSCLYNVAEFSEDGTHYVLTCAGPGVPHISVHSLDGEVLNWENNEELQELQKIKRLPQTKRFTFEVDGGFKAQVSLKLPPDFDPSGNTKYPMLVNVYAGPDSFQVVEKYTLDWGSYLAANKSIIYATIDGRGSGLKGDNILFSLYRRLGTVEIVDQINVTKQIQETLPYVDARRTAIWGWSYGGYASGMILANDTQGIFKCGISVAPVTDWALYDSIYTERFMGLPTLEDNYKGYYDANLQLHVEGLRDKQYFLIHGTYDDNVHYQQSMLWAKALERHDILFRQLSYTDEDHGLVSVRPHLYHSLEDFLDECFIEKSN